MNRRIWVVVCMLLGLAALLGLFLRLQAPPDTLVLKSTTRDATAPASPSPATTTAPPACSHTVPQLPATYTPPDVSDPALRKLVDRRLSQKDRIPPNIMSLIPEVKDPRDVAVLAKLLADPEEPDSVRNEFANILFRIGHAGLEETLLAVLENPAEKARFRSWAVQHLGTLLAQGRLQGDPQQMILRMRHWLQDRHVEVRREALLALTRQRDPIATDTTLAWLKAKGPEADDNRDIAIRCVRELDLREQLPLIRSFARSTNDTTRIAAIVTLREWHDTESRPAIEEAATSTVIRVQQCAKAALAKLSP